MAEGRLALAGPAARAVAEVEASALEVVEPARRVGFAPVAGGGAVVRDIAPPRHPALDVDHVRVLLPEVARAALQQAVGEFESFEQGRDEAEHLLVPVA